MNIQTNIPFSRETLRPKRTASDYLQRAYEEQIQELDAEAQELSEQVEAYRAQRNLFAYGLLVAVFFIVIVVAVAIAEEGSR